MTERIESKKRKWIQQPLEEETKSAPKRHKPSFRVELRRACRKCDLKWLHQHKDKILAEKHVETIMKTCLRYNLTPVLCWVLEEIPRGRIPMKQAFLRSIVARGHI